MPKIDAEKRLALSAEAYGGARNVALMKAICDSVMVTYYDI